MSDLTNLRLEVFPNPTRDDGVFVAEDKPLEPYAEGERSSGFPFWKKPQGYMLDFQIEREFAERIVACVNYCRGKTNAEMNYPPISPPHDIDGGGTRGV